MARGAGKEGVAASSDTEHQQLPVQLLVDVPIVQLCSSAPRVYATSPEMHEPFDFIGLSNIIAAE